MECAEISTARGNGNPQICHRRRISTEEETQTRPRLIGNLSRRISPSLPLRPQSRDLATRQSALPPTPDASTLQLDDSTPIHQPKFRIRTNSLKSPPTSKTR